MAEHLATFLFQIDWNRDGDYSDAGEDITSYVKSANWNVGFREPYRDAVGNTSLSLTLDNSNGDWSPENINGAFYANQWSNRPIRILGVYSGGTATLWTGYTDKVQPTTMSRSGDQTAILNAVGVDELLRRARFDVGILQDKRSDEVIQAILDDVKIPPATPNGPWIAGVAGYSEAGISTYAQASALTSALDAGKITFGFVGDTWAEDTPAWDAIASIAAAERGKAFVDRAGAVVFYNRHRFPADYINDENVTDADIVNMQYQWIPTETTHNVVIVSAQMRKLGNSDTETLYELDEPITIPAGEIKRLRPRLGEQNSNTRIAAVDVRKPTVTDGTFRVRSGQASIITFDVKLVTVDVEIQNTGTRDAVIDVMTIKGRKLTQYNKLTVIEVNGESIFRLGKRKLVLDLELIQTERDARGIAQYELYRRSGARGEVQRIDLISKNASTVTRAMTRTVGDRIRISETKTGHAADYFIIGEEHRVREGLRAHQYTYYLESADARVYWIAGVANLSEAGQTTIAGPY